MIGLNLLLTLGSSVLIGIGWGFEILTPTPKSIFREEYISFVVRVNPQNAKEIIIRTLEENVTLKVEKDRKVYCRTIQIVPGKNTIEVEVIGKDGKKQKKEVSVFMASQVYTEGSHPPSDYKVNPFHVKNREVLCADCHTISGASEQDSCMKCHGKIVSRKFPHPPSMGSCTMCHTGNEKSKYAWNDPISETCYLCHGDKKQIWLSKKYMHGPPATGNCYICHNPHSEDVRFFLKKQTNDLCTTCHSEKMEEKHPLVGFVFGEAHPVSGKPDPARPGFELSCTGCHNPHASNFRFFFQNDYSGEAILCLRCHKK